MVSSCAGRVCLLVVSCLATIGWSNTKTCFADDSPPVVVVETVVEAQGLDAKTRRVKIVMRDHDILAAVLKKASGIQELSIDFPGNRMKLESIVLLQEFKNLERLDFRGDPFMSDKKFTELGKLESLKSLRLALL